MSLTVQALTDAYRADPLSAYCKPEADGGLRQVTKDNVDSLIKRINLDIGFMEVSEIADGRFLTGLHTQWLVRGVYMAHSLMAQLRILATYGSTLLEPRKNRTPCRELKAVLSGMKFKNGKPRSAYITADQADLIRTHARTEQVASIAWAQAFQFECAFRQKDVIGAFEPMHVPIESNIVIPTKKGPRKWVRGITWDEIDDKLILRHVTSKKSKREEIDLKLCLMVIDELSRVYPGLVISDAVFEGGELIKEMVVDRSVLPASGPVIVDEKTGKPWRAEKYREWWREFARAVGIPDEVQNRDSRSGAATETTEFAGREHAQALLGHSDIATTAIYDRAKARDARRGQLARIKGRAKTTA